MTAELADQRLEDELLLQAVADGPHERSCELAGPDVPCTCEVRVAQAAIRLLSVKHAWRGEAGDDVGFDCDGRAMVTFRADGDVEIYIPNTPPPQRSAEGDERR